MAPLLKSFCPGDDSVSKVIGSFSNNLYIAFRSSQTQILNVTVKAAHGKALFSQCCLCCMLAGYVFQQASSLCHFETSPTIHSKNGRFSCGLTCVLYNLEKSFFFQSEERGGHMQFQNLNVTVSFCLEMFFL